MAHVNFWLSYDLTDSSNYTNLYAWLDSHNALECGNSIAFIKDYEYLDGQEFIAKLKSDLLDNVKLSEKDRVYVLYSNAGKFILGGRKVKAPWYGYKMNEQEEMDS